jgi:hypothetical protein
MAVRQMEAKIRIIDLNQVKTLLDFAIPPLKMKQKHI